MIVHLVILFTPAILIATQLFCNQNHFSPCNYIVILRAITTKKASYFWLMNTEMVGNVSVLKILDVIGEGPKFYLP